jgi:acyl carrier protein
MAETAILDREDLRQTVAEVLDIDDEDLTDDAHFIEDLEVDSLMALEVMVVLEKKYGVKLEESELKQVTTLEKTYNLLDARLNGAP